jgi:hypothetical protein
MTRFIGSRRAISKPVTAAAAVAVGGSLLFNGTTQFLRTTGSSGTIGTGATSFEAWVRMSNISATQQTLFTTNAVNGLVFQLNNAGFSIGRGLAGGGTTTLNSFAFTFGLNTWYHVVWVRNGTSAGATYGMVNGTLVGATQTNTQSFIDQTISFGSDLSNGVNWFNGYATNLRWVNGAVAYPSTGYTVPTTNLTSIASTTILLNVVSSAAYLADSGPYGFTFNAGNQPIYDALSPYV